MTRPRRYSVKCIRGSDRGYVAFHAPRYRLILDLLHQHGVTPRSKVLDIGPSRLTWLIREEFGVAVDSLGFGEDQAHDAGKHFQFDLNLALNREQWRRDLPAYDFVLMAEVLEHLYTAPELVLAYVRTLVADNGLLILQTPNAASLPKRLKLLLGRNPYEMIRLEPADPGHYREYTIAELKRLVTGAGFRTERLMTAYWFDARFAHHETGQADPRPILGVLKNVVYRMLPMPLREGITIICRST